MAVEDFDAEERTEIEKIARTVFQKVAPRAASGKTTKGAPKSIPGGRSAPVSSIKARVLSEFSQEEQEKFQQFQLVQKDERVIKREENFRKQVQEVIDKKPETRFGKFLGKVRERPEVVGAFRLGRVFARRGKTVVFSSIGPFSDLLRLGNLPATVIALPVVSSLSAKQTQRDRLEQLRVTRGPDLYADTQFDPFLTDFTGIGWGFRKLTGGVSIQTSLGLTGDFLSGVAAGVADAFSRLWDGEGLNSFHSMMRVFRSNMKTLPPDEFKKIAGNARSRVERQLDTDGQITQGWKKLGPNGG